MSWTGAAQGRDCAALVSLTLTLRCEAEGDREHNATPGEDVYIVLTVDGSWTRSGERIRIRGAICLDGLRQRAAGQRDAGDGGGVEDVVKAQAKLGLVKSAATPECVVDESVRHVETSDRVLVVVLAVVDVLLADFLVEEGGIPAMVSIGHADGFDVGRSLLDPLARGCSNGELWRGWSATRAAVATDVQGA